MGVTDTAKGGCVWGTLSCILVSLTSVSSSCVLSALIFANVTVKIKVTVRGSEKGWTKSPQASQCLKLSQSLLWEWEESSLQMSSVSSKSCRHQWLWNNDFVLECGWCSCAAIALFPLRVLIVPCFQHDKHTWDENARLYPHRGAPNYRRDPEVMMTMLHECKVVLSKRAPGEPLILPCLANVHLGILGSRCSHVFRGHLDFCSALDRSVSPLSL